MLELKDICFERDNKKILDHINLKLDNNKFYVITLLTLFIILKIYIKNECNHTIKSVR